MSEVTLQIGSRPYKVACADGEEAHLRHLASMIEVKLESLGGNSAVSEAQGLLFAALFLADELDEARRMPPPAPLGGDGTSTQALEIVAERLEALADTLEKAARAT